VITEIEECYHRHGQPAMVRVPSFMAGTLSEPLALRGYGSEGESCVLHGAIEDVAGATDPDVELLPRPTAEWLATMSGLQGYSAEQRDTYQRITGAVAVPAAFAALRIDGRIAALAYGAVHDRLLVYESVITGPSWRRRGFSRRLIAVLAGWGRNNGAKGVCLQVEAGNTPARALYDSFGLKTELYRYQYWREPPRKAVQASTPPPHSPSAEPRPCSLPSADA
jgi:N-acetylglutamate synthase